ncbi:iron complex outermembrane receptor protein [Pseudoteredinibacter isoporae]|uniref:Iron complex outermembrane receptor protein n=2 Tax=Pseudoteredinibacter isoporae TaxID=570281 RepID=A0A7X0JUC9_9GAMM|nr:TonB-dependent receptor [Pseudoteredinibacter isoporae]MBB6522399.1 iron complex outermembrane receptor protein [Pseudoteredinibacter isoporae]
MSPRPKNLAGAIQAALPKSVKTNSASITMSLLCGGALFATSAPSFAQEGKHWQIEEVTVTARKREESLQDTPIAVTAFSGEGMEKRGMTQLNGIAAYSPNMSFQSNPSFGGASNAASIYIRGVGQKEFLPTTEPGVGLYVDGVYIARSVGAILDLVDIAQVEVLRGPQGTLFGRNTIGGAISITSQKPSEEFSGKISTTVGTDSKRVIKGSVDIPLSENVLSRISFADMQQDGYVQRSDGLDLGDDNTQTGRLNVLWTPSDASEVNFSVEFSKDRENGPAMTLLGINLGNPIDPETPPMAVIHNVGANAAAGATNGAPCATPDMPINLAVPGCYDLRYQVGSDRNLGTAPAFSDSDFMASNLNVSIDITDQLSFKSITAWRDLDATFARDGDHSPHRVSQFHDTLEQQQFTQEFQLLGNHFDDSLNWIFGLYYFNEDGNNVNTLDFVMSNFTSGGRFENTSKAAFGQATWNANDWFSLTMGLRYTEEDKSFSPDQVILNNYFAGSGHPLLDAPFMQVGTRVLPLATDSQSISELTPMINASLHISEELMVYSSYSEGFKSGGFTQRVFPPQVAGFTAPAGASDQELIPDFAPEFVEVYELGAKYSGLDGRLRLNGAVFHTNYDDLQVQVFTSVAPVTKNAASAKITGWELELQWLPAESWLIEASYGYLNARYDDISFDETFIRPDNEFERVPEKTASLAINHDWDLADAGTLSARIDWSYRSKEYMDSFNTELIAQPSYDLINANLNWSSSDEQWELMLALKNISDEQYLMTGIIGDAFQTYEGIYNRGREFSLTAQYHF